MRDEHLDQMVRAADAYRPDGIGNLDGAARSLLEEIMSAPTLKSVSATPESRLRTRRGLRGGLVGTGVAAAVLVGAVVVTSVTNGHGSARSALVAPGDSNTGRVYSAMVLKAAEANPRLLIDENGWTVETVYGFAEAEGTIRFHKGAAELEMNWRPSGQYREYYQDRLGVSKPETVQVAGSSGDLFTYSANDFAVMLPPRDESFVEMRGQGPALTRAEFDRILSHVIRADVRAWLAALPAEIVTPDKVQDRAAKLLDGVPLPPGFDTAKLDGVGTSSPYHFGARVTAQVGCGWIAEWLRAEKAGDKAALKRAGDALRGSRDWKVLKDMQGQGGWSSVFWKTVDRVAAGDHNVGYQDALGC